MSKNNCWAGIDWERQPVVEVHVIQPVVKHLREGRGQNTVLELGATRRTAVRVGGAWCPRCQAWALINGAAEHFQSGLCDLSSAEISRNSIIPFSINGNLQHVPLKTKQALYCGGFGILLFASLYEKKILEYNILAADSCIVTGTY